MPIPAPDIARPPACPATDLIDEAPIALVYDGTTLAVMLATPTDLEDFAVGFTRTEGISDAVPAVTLVRHAVGHECRMSLPPADALALRRKRRALAGTSSCGLCGARSLAAAVRAPATVPASTLTISDPEACSAVAALRDHQPLHDRTRAAHAAALYAPGRGLVLVREDVGRHTALDKLAGAAIRSNTPLDDTALVLTSRLSVEMVQKAAALGVATVIAVSAPTSLAVRMAQAAGITLRVNLRHGHGDTYPPPSPAGRQLPTTSETITEIRVR